MTYLNLESCQKCNLFISIYSQLSPLWWSVRVTDIDLSCFTDFGEVTVLSYKCFCSSSILTFCILIIHNISGVEQQPLGGTFIFQSFFVFMLWCVSKSLMSPTLTAMQNKYLDEAWWQSHLAALSSGAPTQEPMLYWESLFSRCWLMGCLSAPQ